MRQIGIPSLLKYSLRARDASTRRRDHRIGERADLLDLDAHHVADLRQDWRIVIHARSGWRSGGEHIAGLEREHARQRRDELPDAEQHLGSVRLADFKVIEIS